LKAIVFLGGGRITSALVAGLHLAKYRQAIIVHDRNAHKLRQLKRAYGVRTESDLHSAVNAARLLIVAVRPDSVSELLQKISGIQRPLNAVSLAAGIPLAALRKQSGPSIHWARAMPSPVCRSGRGLTALTFAPDLPRSARKEVRDFFSTLGPVIEISEDRFGAFTVTYSCSHGYHALAALAAAGEKLGLPRKIALAAASHALADGILAWRDSGISLSALIDEAATPGGIAAAVMDSMDKAGYKRSVERGLNAGLKRISKVAKR
jgi:pyrroline-5-carboxylate reductase